MVYLDGGLTVWGSGFQPFEPVQVYFDLQGTVDPNLGFVDANGGGAWELTVSGPLTAISGVNRDQQKLLALNAVSLVGRGADGSMGSVAVKVGAETPPVIIRPQPDPVPFDVSLVVNPVAADGGTTTAWGAGYQPGEIVNFFVITGSTASGVPIRSSLGNATANSQGGITAMLEVTLGQGVYTLQAVGLRQSQATAPLLVGVDK
jgi:hypothetical protein